MVNALLEISIGLCALVILVLVNTTSEGVIASLFTFSLATIVGSAISRYRRVR